MTQSRNKILDDLSHLMTNAMGVAQGARTEAETAMKGWIDRWIAERDLVVREDFEALRAMVLKLREDNLRLAARIAALEAEAGIAPVEDEGPEVAGSAEADEAAASESPDLRES